MPLLDPSILNRVGFIVSQTVVGIVTDLLSDNPEEETISLLVYNVVDLDYCTVNIIEEAVIRWDDVLGLVGNEVSSDQIVSLKEAFEEVLITFYEPER